jgi:predicted phage tail protein
LNVKSPAEAVRAIDAQRKGFRKYFLDTGEKGIGYEVIVGDQGLQQEEGLLYPSPMRDDYTFVPVPQGGKSRAMGMIMMGAALFITAGMASGAFAMVGTELGAAELAAQGILWGEHTLGTAIAAQSFTTQAVMMMGGSLMMGGVAQMLAPTIDSSAGNSEQSYLFDGAINSAKQGTPVPILYGRLTVGGAVISASIKSNQETGRVKGYGRRFVTGIGNAGFVLTGMGGGCFIANTNILMGDGTSRYIQDITIGDIVRSFDLNTNSLIEAKVTETFIHNNEPYLTINDHIETTSIHPFYSNNRWIDAGELLIGDKILNIDGTEHTIKTITNSNSATVYNIEVDKTHNYFAEGYLVHNKKDQHGQEQQDWTSIE